MDKEASWTNIHEALLTHYLLLTEHRLSAFFPGAQVFQLGERKKGYG